MAQSLEYSEKVIRLLRFGDSGSHRYACAPFHHSLSSPAPSSFLSVFTRSTPVLCWRLQQSSRPLLGAGYSATSLLLADSLEAFLDSESNSG